LVPHDDEYLLWPFREHCKIPAPSGPRPRYWGDWAFFYPDGELPPHPDVALADWHGEFLGTWIAAAIVAATDMGDSTLKAKVDGLVSAWLALQEDDGYLGTHDTSDRWRSWDIWAQAHTLIGLLTYYEHTHDDATLSAALRLADLLLAEFGPGKRSLHETGLFGGMASSAVLEPIIWLYRVCKDPRFLEWARWLVDVDWEQPTGPRLISFLAAGKGVGELPHTKAAEMLIDLAGVLELYRETGEDRYINAVVGAWEDVSQRHLYITGSASADEFFGSTTLPNDGSDKVGETCVTMCWIYLSSALGRLTGEARFYDAIEIALYNHLLAAQSPDGRAWAYYVGLRDSKKYAQHTDPACCPTRGSRALCLAPRDVFRTDDRGVIINLYERAEYDCALRSGQVASIQVETAYPFAPTVAIRVRVLEPEQFAVRFRVPSWCDQSTASVNGESQAMLVDANGYFTIDRRWSRDDVQIEFAMPVRVVLDANGNRGSAALMRGPLVYAVDATYLPKGQILDDVVLLLDPSSPAAVIDGDEPGSIHLLAPRVWTEANGASIWGSTRYRYLDASAPVRHDRVRLVPFYEAGNREPSATIQGTYMAYCQFGTPPSNSYRVWNPYVGASSIPKPSTAVEGAATQAGMRLASGLGPRTTP
jgi:uncharacterized protein